MRRAAHWWMTIAGITLWITPIAAAQVERAPLSIKREEFGALMTKVRQAGLQRDPKQAAFLIQLLKQPPDMPLDRIGLGFDAPRRAHFETALFTALGRLGEPSTLDTLIQIHSWKQDHPHYLANRARIQTEVQFRTLSLTLATLRRKIDFYLEHLGPTRSGLQAYLKDADPRRSIFQPPSLEIVALRQIAEMVADAHVSGVKDAFEVLEELDYHIDPPTLLRVQITAVPPNKRADWLIARIKERSVVDNWANYEVQALIDCGKPAANKIVAAIQELLSQPKIPVAITLFAWALGAIEPAALESLLQVYPDHPGFSSIARETLKFSPMVRASDW
jgi:hypothetical protein